MKVWNYMFIALTMILFLTFFGFETGFSPIFELVGFNSTIVDTGNSTVLQIESVTTSDSNIFNTLFSLVEGTFGLLTALGLALGAIAVGFFVRAKPENLILLPFITATLVLFVQTFVGVMSYSVSNFPTWATAVIVIILLPFTVGYIVAMAEFFRGTD